MRRLDLFGRGHPRAISFPIQPRLLLVNSVPHPRTFCIKTAYFSTASSSNKFAEALRAHKSTATELPQPAPGAPAKIPREDVVPTTLQPPVASDVAAPNANPGNLFARAKKLVVDYGPYALVLYSAMWVVPLASLYQIFYAFDNFGHNPTSILQFFGVKDQLFAYFSLSPDARPERYQISGVYAYLGTEIIEPARFGLTLYLAPRLKSWWQNKRSPPVPIVDDARALIAIVPPTPPPITPVAPQLAAPKLAPKAAVAAPTLNATQHALHKPTSPRAEHKAARGNAKSNNVFKA
jgi:hypothetical protein